MEPQTMEHIPKTKSVHNKERYEQKEEGIVQYRRGRYRTLHTKDLNVFKCIIIYTLAISLILCIIILERNLTKKV